MSTRANYRVAVRGNPQPQRRRTLVGAAWCAANNQRAGYQVTVTHRDGDGVWSPVDWEPYVPQDRSAFYNFSRLPRLPWLPVAALLTRRAGTADLPVSAMARDLGVHPKQVYRWQGLGIRVREADRLADRLEVHPAELWVDYYEISATTSDSMVAT